MQQVIRSGTARLLGLLLVAGAVAISTIPRWGLGAEGEPSDATRADEIILALNYTGLKSLGSADGAAQAVATAGLEGGESLRSMWYASVAGTALAWEEGLSVAHRTVIGPDGSVVEETADPVDHAPAPSTVSEGAVRASAGEAAAAAGLTLDSVHWVDLQGGGAEVVVSGTDAGDLEMSALLAREILGPLGEGGHPYLLTFLGKDQEPLLIIGFVPGLGGTSGQGIAWAAPGVDSNSLIGQPIRVEG